MESYLENFGDVKGKNSSDEALRRWRKLCSVVKNPKRRFRFTANLDKRGEAQAINDANHVRASPSPLFPLPLAPCCLILLRARALSLLGFPPGSAIRSSVGFAPVRGPRSVLCRRARSPPRASCR
jgi:hypothetical protein